MKMLLNLGVSNPLTLGMAHPIADRLETLGRARPTTWRSRCLTLSAMGVLAIASAPLSIAEDTQDNVKTESAYKFIFDQTGKESQRFEVRLSLSNGQPFDLPNIDFSEIENLKGLKGLAALKDLKGLTGLAALSDLQGIDFEDAEIHILNSSGTDLSAFNSDEFLAKFPKAQLEALAEDETLSFDLQNALRDLESAQKSLEAAEERLERAK